MKKFNKTTAIVSMVFMIVILAIGFVFSFVPIQFSKGKFNSLSKTINISTDMVGGLYGEYEITTENPTEGDIIDSISLIRGVFESDGYKNVNVYAIGTKKVRIELSYPNGDESFSTSYSKLKNVGAGAFSLSNVDPTASSSSSSDTTDPITVEGAKYVKEVTVATNNDQKYITIKFNKEGQKKYQELCEAVVGTSSSGTLYLVLGEYSQGITIYSSVSSYTELTLSNEDWDNMIALEQKIQFGCTKVELDGDNSVVNTMSATLSAGEASSSSLDKSFFSSTAYVVTMSAFIFVLVLMIAIFAIKFGFFAIIALVSMLFNTYLFLFIAWLVPSFELGLSVVLSLVVGSSLIYAYVFSFAQTVKLEYDQGKSLQASLESSYKKSILGEVITNVILFLSSLILMAFSFSELSSVAISFAILSALSLFTNLCVVPFLVKIGISFKGLDRKLFLLAKRKNLDELVQDAAKEEN